MLERDMFETGVRRIGAEQEMFLVGPGYRPAPLVMEMIQALKDPHFTTEDEIVDDDAHGRTLPVRSRHAHTRHDGISVDIQPAASLDQPLHHAASWEV